MKTDSQDGMDMSLDELERENQEFINKLEHGDRDFTLDELIEFFTDEFHASGEECVAGTQTKDIVHSLKIIKAELAICGKLETQLIEKDCVINKLRKSRDRLAEKLINTMSRGVYLDGREIEYQNTKSQYISKAEAIKSWIEWSEEGFGGEAPFSKRGSKEKE